MTPDPKHVDAVAHRICDASMDIADRGGIPNDVWDSAVDDAEAILTSTDPAVLDAMQDALVRAGRLHKVHDVRYDIVATDEDGQKDFQHGGSDPWRLRQWLADHPNHYRPGSRVERRIARWLTTDTTGEWEPWEPIP